MTTIQIDISCNGDECGECEEFAQVGQHKYQCDLFGVLLDEHKRCPACHKAERRAKGE